MITCAYIRTVLFLFFICGTVDASKIGGAKLIRAHIASHIFHMQKKFILLSFISFIFLVLFLFICRHQIRRRFSRSDEISHKSFHAAKNRIDTFSNWIFFRFELNFSVLINFPMFVWRRKESIFIRSFIDIFSLREYWKIEADNATT